MGAWRQKLGSGSIADSPETRPALPVLPRTTIRRRRGPVGRIRGGVAIPCGQKLLHIRSKEYGLQMNTNKSKVMVFERRLYRHPTITLDTGVLECVPEFVYVGRKSGDKGQ